MNKYPSLDIIFKRTFYFILVFHLFLAAGAGASQINGDSNQYNLSVCFHKASQKNKDIVVAKRNIAIAKAQIKTASAIPNPLVQVQTGFGHTFTQLFTGQTQQVYFTEQIQTAGKRSKKINLARAYTGLTELQLEAVNFDVHNKVRRAYAELAAAQAYYSLIDTEQRIAVRLLTVAKKRFGSGNVSETDCLQANLNVLQFDTQRNQAQARLKQSLAVLALVVGDNPEHTEIINIPDNGLFKLSSESTETVPSLAQSLCPLKQFIFLAYNARPDLKASEQQVRVNRNALSLARAHRIPDLFIGAGFTFSSFSKNQPAGLIAQPNWLGQGAFLNLAAETPVFYQHQGEIQQALAHLRNAEKQVDLLQAQISTDIVVAYNAVKAARTNIFLFRRQLLPTAERLAQIASHGYEAGRTNLAAAIIAQQQYQQTLSNYFDAVVNYQNAWADLERGVGSPLQY